MVSLAKADVKVALYVPGRYATFSSALQCAHHTQNFWMVIKKNPHLNAGRAPKILLGTGLVPYRVCLLSIGEAQLRPTTDSIWPFIAVWPTLSCPVHLESRKFV